MNHQHTYWSILRAFLLLASLCWGLTFSPAWAQYQCYAIDLDQGPDGRMAGIILHTNNSGTIASFESDRSLRWARKLPSNVYPEKVAALRNGAVIAAVRYKPTVSESRIHLLMFDNSGTPLWQRHLTVNEPISLFDLAPRPPASVVVAFGKGGGSRSYFAEYDLNGNALWEYDLRPPFNDPGLRSLVAVDSAGNSYFLQSGSIDYVLYKRNAGGFFEWVRTGVAGNAEVMETWNDSLVYFGSQDEDQNFEHSGNLYALTVSGSVHAAWNMRGHVNSLQFRPDGKLLVRREVGNVIYGPPIESILGVFDPVSDTLREVGMLLPYPYEFPLDVFTPQPGSGWQTLVRDSAGPNDYRLRWLRLDDSLQSSCLSHSFWSQRFDRLAWFSAQAGVVDDSLSTVTALESPFLTTPIPVALSGVCVPLGIAQLDQISVTVGPSPFVDHLQLDLRNVKGRGRLEFLLWNAAGRLLLRSRVQKGVVQRLARSGLPSGVYFWELRGNGQRSAVGKVIRL